MKQRKFSIVIIIALASAAMFIPGLVMAQAAGSCTCSNVGENTCTGNETAADTCTSDGGDWHPGSGSAGTAGSSTSCGTTYDVSTIQLIVGVSPDGICGPQTVAAIKQYQTQHNLNPDGIVGPQTAQAMGLQTTGNNSGSNENGTSGTAGLGTTNTNNSSNPLCSNGTMQNGICIPTAPYSGNGIASQKTLSSLISLILTILLTLAGVVAVVLIIVAGFRYMTAGGNEEQAEKGRKALVNAVIGLAIVILAFAIVTIITNLLTGTTGF